MTYIAKVGTAGFFSWTKYRLRVQLIGMIPEVGSYVYIQSFKHDGSLHRTWCRGYVLEADEDHIVAVTDKAWVIESDGRKWLTREPAICFFYMHEWFNVISMIRHSGIYYYCNIASPSIYDGEAIKNVDYDLDIKLYPDGGYEVLDENEYAEHKEKMRYPKDIQEIIDQQIPYLVRKMEKEELPFSLECIDNYYSKYLDMVSKES